MTLNTEDLLNSIMDSLDRIGYVKPEDIPNIDLYMDQVTTFMDSKMHSSSRHPGEDKILTKTMINNYAKNDLLPPPIKKKYSKEHVLLLIFIYYYKGILSITDIQTLLTPITERYFQNNKDFDLESIYREVFSMEDEVIEEMKKDVRKKFLRAQESFQEAPGKDLEFLRKFSFICMLSFDVYVKKLMIETMIDQLAEEQKAVSEMRASTKEKKSASEAKSAKEKKVASEAKATKEKKTASEAKAAKEKRTTKAKPIAKE